MTGARDPGDQLDRLYRAAWALCGSPRGAERLVEQAFRAASRRGRRTQDGELLRQLLRGVRKARAADGADLTDDPVATVYAAIAQLPESLRDAVVAVDVAGLSNPQAAWALRVAETALGTRLFRGRRELARGFDGHPA